LETVIHNINKNKIAELISDNIIINNLQDALDLIGNISYLEVNKIIIREKNITPEFFTLSSGLAGEILQKCVNYKMKLAIVGDFTDYMSKSLKAFIIESNRGSQFFFVDDAEKAKAMLLSS